MNRAAQFRARYPGWNVDSRGHSMRLRNPANPSKTVLESMVGTPFHKLDGVTEIDTAWTPTSGVWQHEMLGADYVLRAKSAFNGAPLLRFENEGEFVTLQPRQLNWTNDQGDVQLAGNVANVAATVNDDTLRWSNAYGAGRHFEYTAKPNRLVKKLILDSYASLPAPSAQILGGGNPVLQTQFAFAWSNTITPHVDGVAWTGGGGSPTLTTAKAIEFRRANGTVAFQFGVPHVIPTGAEEFTGVTLRVSRSGPNILVEVRTPQAQLQAATYPVLIDPTIDPVVGASDDDAHEQASPAGAVVLNAASFNVDAAAEWNGIILRGITITPGSTIDVAYFTFRLPNSGNDEPLHTFSGLDTATPAAFTETDFDISGRTPTTATVVWDNTQLGIANGDAVNTPSMEPIVTELVGKYTYSNGVMGFKWNNNAQAARDLEVAFWDHSTLDPPLLHVESTEGGITLPTIASGATLFSPTVALASQSITLPTIASGAATNVPTLAHQIELPTIGSTAAFNVPTIAYQVEAPTIGSTAALTAPTVAPGAVTLEPPTIDSGAATNVPSLAYQVEPPTIDSGAALTAPTVAPGDVTLEPPTIASGAALTAPTVAPGAVTLEPPTIDSAAATNVPSLAYQVEPPTMASGAATNVPTLAYQVEAPTIGSTAALTAPTVSPGAVTLEPPTIDSGAVANVPTIAYQVEPPTIGSGVTTNVPTLAYQVELPTIASGEVVNVPAVGEVTILELPTIGSTAAFNAPTISPGPVTLEPPTIDSAAAFNVPTLAYQVELPTIGSTAAFNVPTLAYQMDPPTVASGAVANVPTLAYQVETPTIGSTAAFNAPTVSTDTVTLELPTIGSSANLTIPSLAYELQPPTVGSGAAINVPVLTYVVVTPHISSGAIVRTPSVDGGEPVTFIPEGGMNMGGSGGGIVHGTTNPWIGI